MNPPRTDGDGCGHTQDDPSCRCWGVHTGSAWAIINGQNSVNFASAYSAACDFRSSMPDGRYRVQRREMLTVSPTHVCPNCKAAPCDCDKPIWSWVYRSGTHPGGAWRGGLPIGETGLRPRGEYRHVLVDLHTQAADGGIQRGPIQRITEPPFQFEPKPVWDAIRRRWGLVVRMYDPALDVAFVVAAPGHECSLPWCRALTTATFCSDRCIDYGARLHYVEGRRASFEYKITHGKPRHGHAELAWAKKQTETDVAALERAWRAVQHEPAMGDERVFALLDDEGVYE